MPVTTMVDGVVHDSVSVHSRGLAYGDGLFETIRVSRYGVEFLDLHLQRLDEGCSRLKIRYDKLQLRNEIGELLANFHTSIESTVLTLKIMVTRGSGLRGYRFDQSVYGQRILILTESEEAVEALNRDRRERGVRVRICQTPMAINPVLAGLKHLNRLENIMARSEWEDPQIAEGLMLDTSERLIEGTMTNVFLVADGELYTPQLQFCGVKGIIRGLLIDTLAPDIGISVHQSELSRTSLEQAQEVFICNSIIGIWPVVRIDARVKSIGEVTRKFQQLLKLRVEDHD